MKKRISAAVCAASLLAAVAAAPAAADRGSPGTTFPEKPGTNVLDACTSVNGNPGTGIGGVVEQNISPTAGAIVAGILSDACTFD